MKTPLILAFAAGTCSALHAADQPPATSAYQASVAQDQLRKQTQKIREELRALLEEFQNNPAAGAELAQGRAILERLDTLSDKEMMEVVQALRDASRAQNASQANSKIASAGTSQKSIETSLRTIADRLTAQKDEASMRQRLRQMAVRQTSAQRQGGILASRWAQPEIVSLAIAEQEAVKNDIVSAMETLQRLSTARNAAAPAFAMALTIGANGKLVEQANVAATETSAKRFTEASAPQGQVIEVLQQMVDKLNSTRRPEDRVREAATRMNELASTQKQLASATQKSYVAAQANIAKQQSALTDELSVLQREIKQLNQTAGAQGDQTKQAMEAINEMLEKNRVMMDKMEGKTQVVEAQKNAAENLNNIGKMLQEQARGLAANGTSPNDNAPGSAAMDPRFAALQDATSKVLEAKSQLDLAAKNVRRDGAAAQGQMNAANQALDDALGSVAKAGEAVGEEVGENMKGAQKDIQEGKEQAGKNVEMGHSKIGQAQAKVDAALGGLQKAANALAAAKGAPVPGHGDGMQVGKGGAGPLNGGTGNPNGGGALMTDVSATSGISPQDRAALSQLQREKPPLEYNEMVSQYLKNLADGEMPGQ